MSNKNKKTAAAKAKKAEKASKASAAGTENATTTTTPPAAPSGGFLSSSQLSALIFLAMGLSKLMEFASALTEALDEEKAPKVCMSYLNDEETCNSPGFQSLIQAKYYSGINLTLLTAFMILIVWKNEIQFSKVMTCLCISPISTTVLGIYLSQEHVAQGKALHLMLMCFALLATSTPNNKDKIPFLAEQSWNARTLQGLCLMVLVFQNLLDVYRANTLPSLLDVDLPAKDNVRILINFWCIDKLSIALLFFYAMVHFPEQIQRNFLSLVTILQLVQCYYQLPRMMYPFANQQEVEYLLLTTAVFSILAWKGPSIVFKKKLA